MIVGGRAEGEVNWVRLNPAFASRRAAGFSGKGERVSGRALPREVRVETERERERENKSETPLDRDGRTLELTREHTRALALLPQADERSAK